MHSSGLGIGDVVRVTGRTTQLVVVRLKEQWLVLRELRGGRPFGDEIIKTAGDMIYCEKVSLTEEVTRLTKEKSEDIALILKLEEMVKVMRRDSDEKARHLDDAFQKVEQLLKELAYRDREVGRLVRMLDEATLGASK